MNFQRIEFLNFRLRLYCFDLKFKWSGPKSFMNSKFFQIFKWSIPKAFKCYKFFCAIFQWSGLKAFTYSKFYENLPAPASTQAFEYSIHLKLLKYLKAQGFENFESFKCFEYSNGARRHLNIQCFFF